MRKLLIFLMIAIPLMVIFIVNVTVDAVTGIVIIPVDKISITCNADNISTVYDDENNLSQINIDDISKTVKLSTKVYPESATNKLTYWESSDEKVAIVDNYGNVSFIGFGNAEIYATNNEGTKRTSCLFIVTDTKVHDIYIHTDKTELEINETANILASVWPSSAVDGTYTLVSSNPEIISVSGGIATANAVGETTITAIANDSSVGYHATASIIIKVKKSVETVRLYPETENLLLVTNTISLRAIVAPVDASNKKVKYTTTDPLTAVVSKTGVVTFLKAGSVVITVITEDGAFTDSINLTYTGGYPSGLNNIIHIKEGNEEQISWDLDYGSDLIIEADTSLGNVSKQIIYSFNPIEEVIPIQNLIFYSNNESVAIVDQKGLITIVGGGQATIFITLQTSENTYEQYSIGINSIRKIDSINFESNSITTASDIFQITPIFNPVDATETKNISYEIISGENCASINEIGLISFTKAGQIIVKVCDLDQDNISSAITITYTGGYPTDFILNNYNLELNVGDFSFLALTYYPITTSIQEYYFEIVSQVSACGINEVINIDNEIGKITATGAGIAVVKVYVKISENQWISKICNIQVNQDITSIELICDEEIYEGNYISAENIFNIVTNLFPLDVTNTDIIYELSNNKIAILVNNNQIYFNEPGVLTLTAYSVKNNNIRTAISLWYTGGCTVSATVNGIPENIIYGDSAFVVTLSDIIPSNAINKSFRINFSNQTSLNMFSTSYNSNRTQAIINILKSGSATISVLLASIDGSYNILSTQNILVKQKVDFITFTYSSQTISAMQFNLQCNIFPINATQNQITYTLPEEYTSIASISGNILTFNPSENEIERVVVIATLIDINESIKTAQMEIFSTLGIVHAPEGNSIALTTGDSVEYNYSNDLTDSTMLKIITKTGDEYISYVSNYGKLTISALISGYSEIEVQLINKSSGDIIKILSDLKITISIKIENIQITSDDLSKNNNKYITAQNDIKININLVPQDASKEGLTISVSNPEIASFDYETETLHFYSAGTIEILITSADNSCSRSFMIQYTNGMSISYSLNIESDSNFYVAQNYLIQLTSYIPTNSNLRIIDISEILLSGAAAGIKINNSEDGFVINFIKAGTIKLQIIFSDGNEKIVSVNVTSSLSEIRFENKIILTAMNNLTLYPVLLPNSATNKTIIYTSSNIKIATVSSNGIVTFITPGTVIITTTSASNNSVFDTCEITSTMGDVSSFTINYSDLILSVGEVRSLIVNTYSPTNATNLNFSYEIDSSTANDGSSDSVISIIGTTIKCLKGGTAIVKVYITNQNGETISQICNIIGIRELNDISINFKQTLDTYQNYLITSLSELDLLISLTPADATVTSQSITVDNPNIAKIENGKLIFLKEGIIKIIANFNLRTTIVSVRHTRSAISFEIDDSNSSVINNVRTITLNANNHYEVKIKNIIPSDLEEKIITLTLYHNSPNYNNDNVTSYKGNTITGENGGYATYKITVNGFTSSQLLKVNVIRIATSIVCDTEITTPNSIYSLTAYVLPYDTSNKMLTYSVISPSSGVTIDSYGTITFANETTATIEIYNSESNLTKKIEITYNALAKSIIFENLNYVFIGDSLSLNAKVNPYEFKNEEIDWSVSDTNLATITSSGVLIPKKTEGTITITAKLKNYPETISNMQINIYAKISTLILELKNSDDELCGISGKRFFGTYSCTGDLVLGNLTATISNQMQMKIKSISYNSINIPTLLWTTSDPTIARIDNNGLLTILKAGTVTVTCQPKEQNIPSKPIKASYTFTFIEGINIDSANNFSVWAFACAANNFIYKPLQELDKNGNHPIYPPEKIADLQLSQYYSNLPAIIQKNISLSKENIKDISKDLYGNGYTLNLNSQAIDTDSFSVSKSVTINNVNFKGYNFSSGQYLTNLEKSPSVIKINSNAQKDLNITFKNCIIDGGARCIEIKYAKVNFSGCIIKNAYYGAIFLEGIEDCTGNYKITNIDFTNCIIENSLLGCIMNFCDKNHFSAIPKITFNGKVYMFNWQNIQEYKNIKLPDPFQEQFSEKLKDEIDFLLGNQPSLFKTKEGIKYVSLGVISPSVNLNLGLISPSFTFELEFKDNGNMGYARNYFKKNIGLGTYSLENYGLNANSTLNYPGESYMADTMKFWKEIRDLT